MWHAVSRVRSFLDRRACLAAVLVLLLAAAEAIGRYAFGQRGSTGFLNPKTAPIALAVVVIAFVWTFRPRALLSFVKSAPKSIADAATGTLRDRSPRALLRLLDSEPKWLLAPVVLVSVVWAVFTALSPWPVKGLRDLLYLWLMFLVFILFTSLRDRGSLRTDRFVQILLVGFFVVLPALSMLVLGRSYFKDRFSSLVFSPSVFSFVCALMVQLAVTNLKNRWWKIAVVVIGFALMGLSGTRTPFILAAVFVLALLLMGFMKLRLPKSIKIAVPSLVVVAAFLVVFFGQQLRVFQVTEKFGSVHSRLTFYSRLLEDMGGSHYLGGYGAGAAETHLGRLPHLDLLRFWYDYSLLGLITWLLALAAMFYVVLRRSDPDGTRSRWATALWAVWLFATIVLASAHNIFQGPLGVVAISIFFALLIPTGAAAEGRPESSRKPTQSQRAAGE